MPVVGGCQFLQLQPAFVADMTVNHPVIHFHGNLRRCEGTLLWTPGSEAFLSLPQLYKCACSSQQSQRPTWVCVKDMLWRIIQKCVFEQWISFLLPLLWGLNAEFYKHHMFKCVHVCDALKNTLKYIIYVYIQLKLNCTVCPNNQVTFIVSMSHFYTWLAQLVLF